MIALAATVPPGPAQTSLVAVASVAVTLLGAYLVYRAATGANRINDRATFSAQQLAWTQQAMSEATAAKAEAKEATRAAGEAERSAAAATMSAKSASDRADAAEARLSQVGELADRLIDWIARVVIKAHVDGIAEGATPQVNELLRVINGGPPEISTSRLRREEPS